MTDFQTGNRRGLFETKTSRDGRQDHPSENDLKSKNEGRQGRLQDELYKL